MYTFKYKRLGKLFWKSIKVDGHNYTLDTDRMDLFLPDGSIHSLPKWGECEVKLGADWILATKKAAEKDAGQHIPLTVE